MWTATTLPRVQIPANIVVLDNLTANGGILSVTSGNSYRLRFDGTTTLGADTTVFSVGANATAGFANLTLAGCDH